MQEFHPEKIAPVEDSHRTTGLLSFYDRLRRRITDFAAGRGGRAAPDVVEFLLLAPDLFILLLRLTLDREVPQRARSLAGGALLYFILPLDLLPEVFTGPVGYVDDVVLAAAVLRELLDGSLEPWLDRHWSGDRKLRQIVRDVASAGQGLLGDGLYSRVREKLATWGIQLSTEESESDFESRRSSSSR
jgi:uncharacterized membrane protein YkvA (DUF1232 family)